MKYVRNFFNSLPFVWSDLTPKDIKQNWYLALKINSSYIYSIIHKLRWAYIFFFPFELLRNRKAIKFLKRKKVISSGSFFTIAYNIVFRYKLPLKYFFTYKLWRGNLGKNPELIFPDYKSKIYLQAINQSDQIETLKHKSKFDEFCLDKGFQKPKTVLIGGDNDLLEMFQLKKLILKPIDGFGSEDIQFITIDHDKNQIEFDHKKFHPKDFASHLLAKYRGQFILQELIENEESINKLGNGSLCVVRIITMVNEQNSIEIFRPILKIPNGDSPFCEIHHDAIIMGIDQKNGKLLSGINSRMLQYEITKNNKTGVNFKDYSVPYWPELIASCKKIHTELSDIKLIAWDVAINQQGIVFLEGNHNFGLEYHERVYDKSIYKSRLYELISYHLSNFATI